MANIHKAKTCEKQLKQRSEVNNQNPLQCIIADPTLPHTFHHVNGTCSLMGFVFLPLDLVIVWCRLTGVAHHRKELLPWRKKHFTCQNSSQLISQVIKSAGFTPLAIDQSGNKWFNVNLPDSHSISWLTPLIHAFHQNPTCQITAIDQQITTTTTLHYLVTTDKEREISRAIFNIFANYLFHTVRLRLSCKDRWQPLILNISFCKQLVNLIS